MKETKFTPGPWWFEGQGIGPKSFADDQSYGITMPVAYIEKYDWPEEHEANAHLIAAAPELYEACETMLFELVVGPTCREEVIANARTALAKARGEA